MNPFVSLLMDIIIVATLATTIFYCIRLSRQFNQMRADRKAFETLIQGLNLAAAKAEGAVRAFKDMATVSGDALQEKIGKSKALSEELEIMIQAGDSLANRLQALAEKSRKNAAADIAAEEAQAAPRTRAEKDLLEAIKSKQQT